jgi:hypothetical protein
MSLWSLIFTGQVSDLLVIRLALVRECKYLHMDLIIADVFHMERLVDALDFLGRSQMDSCEWLRRLVIILMIEIIKRQERPLILESDLLYREPFW